MIAKKFEINVLGARTEGYKPTPCNCFMDHAVIKAKQLFFFKNGQF